MKNLKTTTLVIALGVLLAGGVTFAAAVWQGTDWITTGSVISAEKIKANFDYLFEQLDDVGGEGGADTLADLSCSTNQIAKYNGSSWVCAVDEGAAGGPGTVVGGCFGSGNNLMSGCWSGTAPGGCPSGSTLRGTWDAGEPGNEGSTQSANFICVKN